MARADRAEVRLLCDIDHAAAMDEPVAPILRARPDLVAHVHLAAAPGRGEPGRGSLDWLERPGWLAGAGHDGFVGLEDRPTRATADTLGFRAPTSS